MRMTVEWSDGTYRRTRERAAVKETTVTAVVEAALRLYLGRSVSERLYRLTWRTESGRLLPGIDLGSHASLFRAMQDPS
jgi:hypothetical protein